MPARWPSFGSTERPRSPKGDEGDRRNTPQHCCPTELHSPRLQDSTTPHDPHAHMYSTPTSTHPYPATPPQSTFSFSPQPSTPPIHRTLQPPIIHGQSTVACPFNPMCPPEPCMYAWHMLMTDAERSASEAKRSDNEQQGARARRSGSTSDSEQQGARAKPAREGTSGATTLGARYTDGQRGEEGA